MALHLTWYCRSRATGISHLRADGRFCFTHTGAQAGQTGGLRAAARPHRFQALGLNYPPRRPRPRGSAPRTAPALPAFRAARSHLSFRTPTDRARRPAGRVARSTKVADRRYGGRIGPAAPVSVRAHGQSFGEQAARGFATRFRPPGAAIGRRCPSAATSPAAARPR